MKREEMTITVNKELDIYLPKIKGSYSQSELRSAYNMMRRHDLGKTIPEGPEAVLLKVRQAVE